MKRHAVRVGRLVLGGLLILIGIIGGFIPILQGWIFIIAGLGVIAPESQRARKMLEWVKAKVERRTEGESDISEGVADNERK